MPGNFGSITPSDIIGSNQSAIQQALSSLRQRVSTSTPWTYGDEGISDAQRQAGTQAGLLRSGGAGIGQLLGLAGSQGARAGSYVGGGDRSGVISELQRDTAGFMDAPSYQAPPPAAAPAAAPGARRPRPEAPPADDLPPMYRGRAAPGENPRIPGNRRPLTPATGHGGGFYGAP